MTRRDQWLAKVCRVCLRPNRDHADHEHDEHGDCCAPNPLLAAAKALLAGIQDCDLSQLQPPVRAEVLSARAGRVGAAIARAEAAEPKPPVPPPTGLTVLPFGVLPTQSALVLPCQRANAPDIMTPRRVLATLRDHVRHECFADARLLLNTLGFTWPDAPTVPDAKLQEAIDSVAASLDDEVTA
jgi:hypothetical protein